MAASHLAAKSAGAADKCHQSRSLFDFRQPRMIGGGMIAHTAARTIKPHP